MDTSEPGFAEALSAAAGRAERMLERCLPRAEGGRGEAELAAAMRHAVLDGGKRLRAFLVQEVAGLFGADGPGAERVAAAVEGAAVLSGVQERHHQHGPLVPVRARGHHALAARQARYRTATPPETPGDQELLPSLSELGDDARSKLRQRYVFRVHIGQLP